MKQFITDTYRKAFNLLTGASAPEPIKFSTENGENAVVSFKKASQKGFYTGTVTTRTAEGSVLAAGNIYSAEDFATGQLAYFTQPDIESNRDRIADAVSQQIQKQDRKGNLAVWM